MNRERMRIVIAWLKCLGLMVCISPVSGQSPELVVEVDRQQVYEGESIVYRVTLNHVEDPVPPTLEGFSDFQVTSIGEQSLDSRRITIVNGVRNEVVRRGRQYQYRLTPLRAGDLTIPAPTAQVGPDALRGKAIRIRVIPPEEQDTVLLEASAEPTAVYPTQPFTLTLTVAVKALPGELGTRDPLSVQPDLPALTVPWLDDEQLPAGIDARESWSDVLQPLVSQQGYGVQINNIRSPSAFSLFEREAMGFRPTPRRTTRPDETGEEADYWEYRFERTFIPQTPGEYEFSGMTLKGSFATGLRGGRLVGEPFYAAARPVRVLVRNVPRTGRPNSFIGAVGKFSVTSQLAPTSARVGDPMTLTVTVSGEGNLIDARPPDLASVPEVAATFRTYEATSETQGTTRRFTYGVRPLHDGVQGFPSIPVSYFDVDQEKYVTLRTDPIPVTITAAETLSEADIVAAANRPRELAGEPQTSEGGIFANDTNFKSMRNQRIRPLHWLGLWLGLLGTYAAAVLGIRCLRRFAGDTRFRRSRTAPTRARSALQQVAAETQAGNHRAACDSLRKAVMGLIADFADVPETGLTPRDAVHRLEAMGVPAELRQQTLRVLADCDAASYGAATTGMVQLERDGRDLVDQLTRALRKRRTATLASVVVWLGLLACGHGCGAPADLETVRQLQAAEASFSQADTREAFVRVALQYQQVLDRGFVAGRRLLQSGECLDAGPGDRASDCLVPASPAISTSRSLSRSESPRGAS